MQSMRQGKKEEKKILPRKSDNEMDDDQSMNKSSYFMSISNSNNPPNF